MITMTTTVFKKTTLALIGLACAAGVIFSVGMQKNDTEVQAAVTETKRVWFTSTDSTWFKDSAKTYIHYWGGAAGTTWPGTATTLDSSNNKYYFDLPLDIPTYMFVRCSPAGAYWSAKTADLSYASSTGKVYTVSTVKWDPSLCTGSFVSFSASTTSIVSALAATIDTSTEACSLTAAQNAINSYNAMATFDQNQFDVLDVGGGFTGLQRLNYLKTRYGITTVLNSNDVGALDNDANAAFKTLLIIGFIGLTTLGSYYVISRRKQVA